MVLHPDQLLSLWERALAAEIGIAMKTNSPRAFQNELYKARQTHDADGRFAGLALVLPNAKDEVWIVHKQRENSLE